MSQPGTATPKTCAIAALVKSRITGSHPKKNTYPPVPSIPITSAERLAQAAEDAPGAADPTADTILYLAYGSNLSAETFLGVRGIRPLSQMNVSVPVLRLAFSLPGLPYREPCFANVAFRKLPEKPQLPDPSHPPQLPLPPYPGSDWDGSLVGVVYEVTQEDWRTIMRTEGAGSSYQEIVTPCIPISSRVTIPEKPPLPDLPKPFLARTLFAPYVPPHEDGDPRKRSWWYRLTLGPYRPDPDYAQPSARYLKLLRDGAREHGLPDYYQEYLESLDPFRRTTLLQQIGQVLLLAMFAPPMLTVLLATNLLADKTGKAPKPIATMATVLFNLVWVAYDCIFKPVFGEGERTPGDGDESSGMEDPGCEKSLFI